MDKVPFYIVTSDATSDILPATCYLYNKYWQPEGGQQFKILGNHSPKQTLPDNFVFIKIKDENNIQNWTRYLYDYILQNEASDFFILTLDDYLPNAPLKPEILQQMVAYARGHKNVGRLPLGRLDVERWATVQDFGGFQLVKLNEDSPYRLSCQTSVWNREYFLKYFRNSWTPWQLELTGSTLARGDGWNIIGVDGDWPFGWMEESALSGRWPDMVNILGIRPEDVKYLIEQNFFNPVKLQYGIWYDCRIPFLSKFQTISKKLTKIPKFSEISYNFHWQMIKPYVRKKTFKRLYRRYQNLYPD